MTDGEVGERKIDRGATEGKVERPSLGQGRHDEGRRANEGANREKESAYGEIGCC